LKANQTEFLELSQEMFDRGKAIRFRAHGRSMHPFIKDGDILIVEPMNGTLANTGDVIFYRLPFGPLVAHRLIRVEHHENTIVLITKGDSLNYYDTPIPAKQVIGKVVCVDGQKRQLPMKGWLARPFGFLIACFARGRYWNQGRFVRNLGRLWWLLRGRRINETPSSYK
jgi:hypothetical protein